MQRNNEDSVEVLGLLFKIIGFFTTYPKTSIILGILAIYLLMQLPYMIVRWLFAAIFGVIRYILSVIRSLILRVIHIFI